MKYKFIFNGIDMGESEYLGKNFQKVYLFKDRSPYYTGHMITFDYSFSPNHKYVVGLIPKSVSKMFSYPTGDPGRMRYVQRARPMTDLLKIKRWA